MASSSVINVYFTTVDGSMIPAQLRKPLTIAGFRKVITDKLGDVSDKSIIAGGMRLDLYDEEQFQRQIERIRDGEKILVVKRMFGGCFLADTFILLSDQTTKLISEVQIGDKLLAFTSLSEIVTSSVQEVFVHDVDEYIELRAGDNMLHVTQEHPFFIGNGSFCSLQELRTNDCIYNLVDEHLQSMPIMSMKTVIAPATRVYNLRTTEPHTYFANGVAVHNKFGVDFVDLSNTSGLQRQEWNYNAPKWRQAEAGLCLEGQCTNASCEANRQEVIINKRFGRIDIVGDITASTSQCPVCHQYVEPKTCGFNRCQWRWHGSKQRQSGMPPEEITADWKIADNAYHRFDQNVSGTVTWRKLIIETKPN
jgi:hypothetical protein